MTTLALDPGRPSKLVLARRFMQSEFRIGASRLARKLGLQSLNDAVPDNWKVPDSEFASRAINVATGLCPDFMIRHCYRAYCFGAILAARHNMELDRELFFVAAILHDLGLSDAHADEPGSFEWVGAGLARDFCLTESQTEARAALVHNSIALHTSMGVAGKYEPEIALLHYGTAMDLFGMRLDEIPKFALEAVLEDYPRSEFKAEFTPCLRHQADAKPDSQIAGAVGIGILDQIQSHLE